MYNVKFFRYPSGWQVRVYDTVVGYHAPPDNFPGDYDDWFIRDHVWDDELQDYLYIPLHPNKTWLNPFTMQFEKEPVPYEDLQEDVERKKQRSLRSSMGRTVNAIYNISRANTWDWFITLTFNPAKVDSLNYGETVKKLSQWIKNIRRICPDMGYIIVPEKHKSGRYHFHGLFRNCEGLGFVPTDKRTSKGDVIYNVGKYRLGWTTATIIQDQSRVVKYIAKYINKDLCQVAFNKRRYWSSRNLSDPDVQEVMLDKAKLDQLVGRLGQVASYIKRVECSEVITTYYELPAGVTDEEL